MAAQQSSAGDEERDYEEEAGPAWSEESTAGASWRVTLDVDYTNIERTRLQERFGSVYSIEKLIEITFDSIVAESLATELNIEYSYRKIKNLPFKEEDLSSFKQEEAEQTVSVSTTYVTGITTMGESY
jgi:hypothetical protein